MSANHEQISPVIAAIDASRKAHRPRRNGGHNEGVDTRLLQLRQALKNGPCANCVFLTIDLSELYQGRIISSVGCNENKLPSEVWQPGNDLLNPATCASFKEKVEIAN